MSRIEYELDSLKNIRFFYNGVKVNGEKKLQKVDYSLNTQDNEKVYITKEGYEHTPADLIFSYKEACFGLVTKENPLYPYIYNAALQANIHWFNTHKKWLERRLNKENELLASAKTNFAKAEHLKRKKEYERSILLTETKIKNTESEIQENIKQPDAKVIEAFKEFAKKANETILNERKAREEERRRKTEEVYKVKASHKEYAKILNNAYPIGKNDYYVKIEWSESPAIEDGMEMSLKAADIYLGFLDKEQHINCKKGDKKEYTGWLGYDKTKFCILNNKKEVSYQGRYDLGDGDVYNDKYGIISHIRCFAEGIQKWKNQYPENSLYKNTNPKELFDFADELYEVCYGENAKESETPVEEMNAS